jgi:hypothetical protein
VVIAALVVPLSQSASAVTPPTTKDTPYVQFTTATPGVPSNDSGLYPYTGNTYGPEVLYEGGIYKMWYGAQADNGLERIFYATSTDGINWTKLGVAVDDPAINLEQDPTVVKVGTTYHMFYTGAVNGIIDRIYHASSTNGTTWTLLGQVLGPGTGSAWDNNLVGRPSVRYESGTWKMWFDGCSSTDPNVACQGSIRSVGYATSTNGSTWTKSASNPIIPAAEAVQVSKYSNNYVLLAESGSGTRLFTSAGGVTGWTDRGIWIHLSGSGVGTGDVYGHVTPFLFYDPSTGKPKRVYMGINRASCWCQNAVGAAELRGDELDRFLVGTAPLGVAVGSSALISSRDFSDTWTEGVNNRVADGRYPVGPPTDPTAASLIVENQYGNTPTRYWANNKWSINKDSTAFTGYPGGSRSGTSTGMTQTGALNSDWGIYYFKRRDYVVQFDAVQTTDRIDITTGNTVDALADYTGISIFVRAAHFGGNPEVGIYSPGVGEYNTGFTTAGLTSGTWHNYAVRFNLDAHRITVFVDQIPLGSLDLNTFQGGLFLPMIGTYTNGFVNVGFAATASTVAWTDNFQVGVPS